MGLMSLFTLWGGGNYQSNFIDKSVLAVGELCRRLMVGIGNASQESFLFQLAQEALKQQLLAGAQVDRGIALAVVRLV